MSKLPSRPTYLEVDLHRLKQNLENIKAFVKPSKVMAVLKANAYGHGVDGVAPFLAPFADYIGLALVEEGIHLRESWYPQLPFLSWEEVSQIKFHYLSRMI